MLLIIDNNDSFTYNLVQMFEEIGVEYEVVSTDLLSVESVSDYSAIVISPGPDLPKKYPNTIETIRVYHDKMPILGVCLGHQAIAEFFGGELYRISQVRHGISSLLYEVDSESLLYKDIEPPIYVGRYHSWAVKELPECLKVTSITDERTIMSFEHKNLRIAGVQYHPESIITNKGYEILRNWSIAAGLI